MGSWTPVYDQALSVSLDGGTRFVANFRYSIKEGHPLQDGASAFEHVHPRIQKAVDLFDSNCGATMIGFVQHGTGSLKSHKIQCFYAT